MLEELVYLFGVGMGKSPHDHTVQEDVVKLFFTYIENFFDLDPATQCVPLFTSHL